MKIRSFLKLVEIQTKVASMIPFILGTVYSLYRFGKFNFLNFILMFISLITVDMATTAVNNYMDYKKAVKTKGYGYETHNAIVRDKLKESQVIAVIFILLAIAVTFGVLLFLNTNVVVLILGAISFAVGILYSFGPIPISRTPFGEFFSGFFMGFIITFISIYIHIFDQNIINVAFSSTFINIDVNLVEVLYIFVLSIPAISGIANIMLANNICDIEDDLENKRYTLPIYIGKEKALKVFSTLYYIAFASILLLVLLKVESWTCLLVLLTLIPVQKNINLFNKIQTKKDTFVVGVKNFVTINVSLILTIVLSLFIRIIF
ncbi:1, 4-dihydroxy-2-naphthoateoctaprenyltransferase [Clostridium sp. N3C]|uniref:1,4-dihydroxy-2-naphthoate polyprenyltransferase n=1 Tax=Clostridium sp. N3C TaxID=1776758 RepID=UPI00092DF1F5|nr:1,4-dihydroxy-2-naphthoate polyprenyltransferase [Clostridium sp. N3C]SCN25656.1 1, 4-dihydroxy-2-naphthoateoctaprenyltransferase [Clostridium sp. N3C]